MDEHVAAHEKFWHYRSEQYSHITRSWLALFPWLPLTLDALAKALVQSVLTLLKILSWHNLSEKGMVRYR